MPSIRAGCLKNPLKIHEVSEGAAQPFVFEAADFDYQDAELTASLSDVSFPGVAGFRLLNPLNVEGRMDELVAFLGASYFRALGAGNVYGLSARALAIDTASGKPGGVSELHCVLSWQASRWL